MSHMGYIITYAVCPVLCCSMLQTEIALSTVEASYITLIQVMRKVITFMALMKEVYFIFDIHIPKPEVFSKVFKDNQSYISVAESNKFSTRTKQIAINYYRFQSFVQNNNTRICYVDTREQTVDIFTKPLD